MPESSAATVLRASARLEADATRLLAKMDEPGCPEAERHRLNAAADCCYGRIAELDRVIIDTRGTPEDGLAKVRMALEIAEADHAAELFCEFLRSGIADIAAGKVAQLPKRRRP